MRGIRPRLWLPVGTALLAECAPSVPTPTAPPREPTAAATSSPFLPRGFVLPGTQAASPPASIDPPAQPEPSTAGLELSTALARLNQVRADEGLGPLTGD